METIPFKNFTNQYAISKTLRFGLTLKNSKKKNRSHEELKNLILSSAERIKKEVASKGGEHDDLKLINDVSRCVKGIGEYLQSWQEIYRRTDQIALTKDYYKRLARKACFDSCWEEFNRRENKWEKAPKSQVIKISSLKNYYQREGWETKEPIERRDNILNYWSKNIKNTKQKLHDFELVLQKYQTALNYQDKAHLKPRLVDFRKMFLSIARLCNETLGPLNNDSICFPDLEKLKDSERNRTVKEFALRNGSAGRKELAEKIRELKDYFEDNGGYVQFGRVTLNRNTAEQKPHNFKEEIEEIIEKLNLLELIKKLIAKTDDDIRAYFEFRGKDKIREMNKENLSIVERVQMFKYKPIPAAVRFMLSDYMVRYHNFDKEKLDNLFDAIGESRNIGQDYVGLKDKSDFDLSIYPLKQAFDYAWENIARDIHNPVTFPKEKCEQFLKKIFNVDTSNENFRLYADLLFIKDNLATLDHEKNVAKDREKFKQHINNTFKAIKLENKDYEKHKKAVLAWFRKDEDEQRTLKVENNYLFKNYEKAKNELGLLRGRQKNNVKSYKDVTEIFKKLAIDYGRYFADLRDKLREENELNKISHFGLIIEDTNKDRYALLSELKEDRIIPGNGLLSDEKGSELKTYQVKSLTSKTLEKLIKNECAYKNFHSSRVHIDSKKIKRNWSEYKNNAYFLKYVKDCLRNSPIAKEQNWAEFECDFPKCRTYEEIERELDTKAYALQERHISKSTLAKLVNEENCLLLPFVNQDITSAKRELKNQFSKDWAMLFDDESNYRLHPEFKIVYRKPTPKYPANKRYSRFQMIAQLLCEYIPESPAYITRKQQIQIFNDKEEQSKQVDAFNDKMKPADQFYVLGIDRGLKQLATLCVLNQAGQIQGGFDIFTRKFDTVKKQWLHTRQDTRDILDLSNLRVETTITGEKVLVDLASIKVKDINGEYTKENQQKIKLKQLAYIRKLQYQIQTNEKEIIKYFKDNPKPEDIEKKICEWIAPYKEGEYYADLPMEKIFDMLTQFKKFVDEKDEKSKKELVELDAAEDLKSGVVANMVGVVAFLLEKYNYNAFISLENLCRAFYNQKDGLTGDEIKKDDETFKEQENRELAGAGTYQFFEMQLLKKLFRVQIEKEIYHLVPAFRSVDNYEKIVRKNEKYSYYPFGSVHFVDPRNTSKKCPVCGETKKGAINRNEKKANIVYCLTCRFRSVWNFNQYENIYEESKHHFNQDEITEIISANQKQIKSKGKEQRNLNYIHNGDDNGAYHIALKTLENLNKQMKKAV